MPHRRLGYFHCPRFGAEVPERGSISQHPALRWEDAFVSLWKQTDGWARCCLALRKIRFSWPTIAGLFFASLIFRYLGVAYIPFHIKHVQTFTHTAYTNLPTDKPSYTELHNYLAYKTLQCYLAFVTGGCTKKLYWNDKFSLFYQESSLTYLVLWTNLHSLTFYVRIVSLS